MSVLIPSRRCRLLCVPFLLLASASALGQAPVVGVDAYSVNANGLLTVPAAGGLLTNDSGFSAATHRLESWDSLSRYNGVVSVASDGSFVYDPVPGFRGLDSFSYTVRNAYGANRATVSVEVSGDVVWFVDASAGPGGDGTFGAPFNSLAAVSGSGGSGDVDAAGETIFVHEGTYAGVEFDLEPGQRLIGHALGLDLVGAQNDVAVGSVPLLTSTSSFPIIEIFGSGGEVHGVNVSNAQGWAIRSSTGANGGFSIADVAVTAGGNSGAVEFLNTSGTLTLTNLSIDGALPVTAPALQFIGNAGNVVLTNVDVGAGSGFTGGYVLNVNGNSGSIAFDASSVLQSTNTRGLTVQTQTAAGSVTLPLVNLAGGAVGEPLVRLQSNNPGSTVNFAQGVVANASAVDAAAFLQDTGRLSIGGTSSILSAADGAVLYLESVELTANATFASLSSNSGPARGISIADPIGNNDIFVTGTTTISNPVTQAVRIDSASASGFLLQMSRLTSIGANVGIEVNNAAVAVTDAASSVTTSAAPAIVCTASTMNLALTTLTAAGGVNGLTFDGCSGTIAAAGGSLNSTAGAGNPVVNLIDASNGTNNIALTYGGTISKTTAGAAVNIVGLDGTGSANFNGAVSGSSASGGVVINNSIRPVTFASLSLGTSAARFTGTPVTLAGNTGAVDLGVLSSYTDGVPALNIRYANASPGLVTTDAGSVLSSLGSTAALAVSHATSQPLALSFASVSAPNGGARGMQIARGTGSVTVTGAADFGPKSTAGVEITNSSNLNVSFTQMNITGAADGVRLTDNTGGAFAILGDGNFASGANDGAGGTFLNLTDNAFDLQNVATVQVSDLIVTGTGGHAVAGAGVTGANIFSNVSLTNIGNADNEHVFNFREGSVSGAAISGSLTVNHSVIENFTDNGVYLENFAGTLEFRWTDNILRNNITTTACGGGNCNGNGILLRADGTARINALIQNAVFEQIDGIGLTANPEGNSGARMDISVISSAFTAATYGGPGHTNNGETAISLRNAQGNSTLNFRLFSNDIYNYTGELALGVVEVEGGDFTTTNGVIDVLYVYAAHLGNVLQVFADGANTAGGGATNLDINVAMSGVNVPAGSPVFGASILLQNNGAIAGSSVDANYSVTDSPLEGVTTGTSRRTLTMNARDFNNACTRIQNNVIAAGSGGTQPSVNLSYNGSGVVRLQGMAGSGDVNAQNYLNANNTLAVGAISGPNNNITSATCLSPTLPAAFPFL